MSDFILKGLSEVTDGLFTLEYCELLKQKAKSKNEIIIFFITYFDG